MRNKSSGFLHHSFGLFCCIVALFSLAAFLYPSDAYAAPPTVTTKAATNVTSSSATLNGTVNANGSSTYASFRYGKTSGSTDGITPIQSISGTNDTPVSSSISGLSAGTTYYYSLAAGSTLGNEMTFTTSTVSVPPTVTTKAATNVKSSSATLNGTVNANGLSTIAAFKYGKTSGSTDGTTPILNISGTSDTEVSSSISGLSAGTTYYYSLVATNSAGSTIGNEMTFTTSKDDVSPTVTTKAATDIKSSSATLNGTVNANGLSTIAAFKYGKTSGSTDGITPIQSISGTSDTTVSSNISGLSAGTTYYYSLVATNSAGSTIGNEMSFTTSTDCFDRYEPNDSPSTASGSPNHHEGGGLGRICPSSDVDWFKIDIQRGGTFTLYLSVPISNDYYVELYDSSYKLVAGNHGGQYIQVDYYTTTTGTYYIRVAGYNGSYNTKDDYDLYYYLDATPPSTITKAATNVTSNSATLNGNVNDNWASKLVCFFLYGTTSGSLHSSTEWQDIIVGQSGTEININISGLSAGTTYYYKLLAIDAFDGTYATTGEGNEMSFTTPPVGGVPPTVATKAATDVRPSSAILNGTVNANGLSTAVTFQYGTTSGSYDSLTPVQSISGSINTEVVAWIYGLLAEKTYYYRCVGNNSAGTSYGNEMSFTTPPVGVPPTVTTKAATNVKSSSATLNATVNANGLSTYVSFQYGTTSGSYDSYTPGEDISGSSNTEVSESISGLSAGTTYYYRCVGNNSAGFSGGSEMSFTTPTGDVPPTVTTKPATNLTSDSATLNGTVNANGLSTIAAFKYGKTSGSTDGTTPILNISGTNDTEVSSSISGLSAGTTYYYSLVATNSAGSTIGNEMTFDTINQFNHFSFSSIPSPQTVGVPFEVTITAKDTNGSIRTDFNGEVVLSTTSGIMVSPTKTNLSNGSKTLTIGLDSPGNTIKIQANGSGKSGESNSFNVTGGLTNVASISGIVIDSTGSRVSGATVNLNDYQTKTDNNGAYQFENLTPGEYTIKASHDDNECMSYKLNLSNKCLTIDLELLNNANKYSGLTPILLVPGIMGSSVIDGLYPTLPAMCLTWDSPDWNQSESYLYHGMLDKLLPSVDKLLPGITMGWENLVKSLQSVDSRYEVGTNIFPVPYDWRMKIDDIANGYLKPWIDEAKKRTGVPKVNIIAHSMGGLVTRAYIQSSGYEHEHDIDKFAMVGTPNHGAGMAYYIWEGGDVSLADELQEKWYMILLPGHEFFTKTLNNIYQAIYGKPIPRIGPPLVVCEGGGCTTITAPYDQIEVRNFVHSYIPSVRQLLPTYKFLKTGTSDPEIIKDTDSVNVYLDELNKNPDFGSVTVKIFAGTDIKTISTIQVGLPNDRYKDGVPIGNPGKPPSGDGTVLRSSASLNNIKVEDPKPKEHYVLIDVFRDELVEFMTGKSLKTVANANRFKTRNALDETSSLNGLVVSVHGRVQPYIVDPQDRKSGINPTTNLREDEIPNSVISMLGYGGSISIENATDGTYTVYLKDGYNEDYRLILSYVDNNNTVQKEYLGFNHANTTTFTFTIESTSEDRLTINHIPIPLTGLHADAIDAEGLKTKLTWDESKDSDVTSYNIYSREDDEPYLKQIGNTTEIYYNTDHPWAENSSIKTRIYAVSALKEDSTESFLSDMVVNNDRDHDGLTDEKEVALGTDVNHPDTDGDKLKDGEEYIYGTNPLKKNTDGDRYNDYKEIRAGSDPLDKDSIPSMLGSVIDTEGDPLESVSLNLRRENTKVSISRVSDAQGFFGFANLNADTYRLTATKAGYKNVTRKVMLKTGKLKKVKIKMHKIE